MNHPVAIGLISGTSVDSIDAAAVFCLPAPEPPRIIGSLSKAVPEEVRAAVFRLFEDAAGSLRLMAAVNMRLGHLFADAVEELLESLSLTPGDVEVVGSHGQTIFHVADPAECAGMSLRGTIQIGEAAVLARRTGIPVVSDFRAADIAAGGAGAPLVPILDARLIDGFGPGTLFQNIGGIANLCYFPMGNGEPLAFDTGPGNMIIDFLVCRFTGGAEKYDKNGCYGNRGRPVPKLLDDWMSHPYLDREPPKTTGREEFGGMFQSEHLGGLQDGPDLIRTAEEYTVRTIAEAYEKFLPEMPKTVVTAGGGAFNPVIMEGLRRRLPGVKLLTGDEAGISTEFKEAAAFALMAHLFLEDTPNNIPSATGARSGAVMGKLSRPS